MPRPGSTVLASSGIPVVPTAQPTVTNASVGATIDATVMSYNAQGPISGTAAYTVSNPRSAEPANSYMQVKGSLFVVDVLVQAETGTTTVNPFFFAMRTEDRTAPT